MCLSENFNRFRESWRATTAPGNFVCVFRKLERVVCNLESYYDTRKLGVFLRNFHQVVRNLKGHYDARKIRVFLRTLHQILENWEGY